VVREAPAASMSTLERIVILPAAAAAAPASPEPETRYIYSENPAAAAIASDLLARRTERGAGEPPMQGEPEAFYHYDPIPDRPDELNVLPPPGAVTRSPMLPTSTAEPETVYSYTVPPAVAEGLAPLVFSPGAAPTGDPESRFTYDVPLSDNDFGRWASQRTGPVWVPALPLSLGWTEPRLPGRQIRYVVDR
jgi:hypothetical protein